MIKKKIILIGGGGHCKACIDVIEHTNDYQIMGVLDDPGLLGSKILDYEVIGTDNDILKFRNEGCVFLVTVGQIKSAEIRKKIYNDLKENKAMLATVISPLANVSKHAQIGNGTIVMHGAKINAAAKIGDNCILNTGCIIEHDTIIGNHTHISTAAVINGDCLIGDEVFIGSNATVSNQVSLSNNIVIGSGSVVLRSVKELGTYVGNPIDRLDK